MKKLLVVLTSFSISMVCDANYHVLVNGIGAQEDYIITSLNSWQDIDCQSISDFSQLSSDTSLIITWRANEYSAAELNAIDSYVRNGGRVLFLGEYVGGFYIPLQNNSIRTALEYMGSTMSLGTSSFDPGWQTAFSEQIIPNPLTEGVSSLSYAGVNSVSGGSPLLLVEDLETPFFAYEQVGDGSVFLSGDSSISHFEMGENDDNDFFFRNLAVAAIPEPSYAMLMLILGGLGLFIRRSFP